MDYVDDTTGTYATKTLHSAKFSPRGSGETKPEMKHALLRNALLPYPGHSVLIY